MQNELTMAWDNIGNNQQKKIFTKALYVAIRDTFYSKVLAVDSLISFGKKLTKHSISFVNDFRKKGVNQKFDELLSESKKMPENLARLSKEKVSQFRSLSDVEQRDLIISAFVASIIFSVSGGGSDLEGGIPDQDLKLGIGFHRNIFSHTILIGLPIEFVMRFTSEIIGEIHDNLPENHSKVWDDINFQIQRNKSVAIGSVWIGIGAHLLKDSSIIAGGFKPYSGLGISMSSAMHKTIFVANSILASTFGIKEIKQTII